MDLSSGLEKVVVVVVVEEVEEKRRGGDDVVVQMETRVGISSSTYYVPPRATVDEGNCFSPSSSGMDD